jgi:hypothetical protein
MVYQIKYKLSWTNKYELAITESKIIIFKRAYQLSNLHTLSE